MTISLTETAREKYELEAELSAHEQAAKARADELRREIRSRALILETATEGLDADKIDLAKTIVSIRGSYARGGDDRHSVVRDAMRQLATGEPVRAHYGDLWRVYFGTKSYDRWHGQRSDHPYGYGPKHGGIIFAVEVTRTARERGQADLTPDEIEAAIYYLTNLERAQAAEQRATAA